jgi:TolB protein
MKANGSKLTRITSNDAFDSSHTWTSSGDKILFNSNRDGNIEIYEMNSDGSQPTRLTFNKAFSGSPTLSSDGKCIAFVYSDDPTDHTSIYIMTIDRLQKTRLTFDQYSALPAWQP